MHRIVVSPVDRACPDGALTGTTNGGLQDRHGPRGIFAITILAAALWATADAMPKIAPGDFSGRQRVQSLSCTPVYQERP
jgi:hypothetical protein